MTIENFEKHYNSINKKELEEVKKTIERNLLRANESRKPHLTARLNVIDKLLGSEEKTKKTK